MFCFSSFRLQSSSELPLPYLKKVIANHLTKKNLIKYGAVASVLLIKYLNERCYKAHFLEKAKQSFAGLKKYFSKKTLEELEELKNKKRREILKKYYDSLGDYQEQLKIEKVFYNKHPNSFMDIFKPFIRMLIEDKKNKEMFFEKLEETALIYQNNMQKYHEFNKNNKDIFQRLSPERCSFLKKRLDLYMKLIDSYYENMNVRLDILIASNWKPKK